MTKSTAKFLMRRVNKIDIIVIKALRLNTRGSAVIFVMFREAWSCEALAILKPTLGSESAQKKMKSCGKVDLRL